MSELAKSVLCFLESESENGKKSFTILDLMSVSNLSYSRYEEIISELEESGYVEVQNNIAKSFCLI